jgi:hypothetical protein
MLPVMRSLTSRSTGLCVGLIGALVSLTACPNRAVTEVDPQQQPQERKLIPVKINRNVDILFVIDDSGSMEGEQNSLAANFGAFMDVLNNIQGGLPNVHIGVISSDVGDGGFPGCSGNGDNGTLQNAPVGGCSSTGLSNGARFISDVADENGNRTRNYSGDLSTTFACIAKLGTQGCGFEHHFESMKRALDGSNSANAGFLRPEAFLAVVIIADEDDCSARNPEIFNPDNGTFGPLNSFRCTEYGLECTEGSPNHNSPSSYTNCGPRTDDQYIYHPDFYVEFLKSLKPNDPQRLIVAGIIGNPEPVDTETRTTNNQTVVDLKRSCFAPGADTSDPNAGARPGVRIKHFLESFPNRNTFTSICDTNLASALTKIAELLASVVGNPCLDAEVDTTDIDPNATGVQLDCSVQDVTNPNTESEVSHTLPRCRMTNDTTPDPASPQPCWYVIPDQANCSTTSGYSILFLPSGEREAPDGTYTFVDCVAVVAD